MGFDKDYKERAAKKLAMRLAQGLKKGEITLKDSTQIASHILDNLDKVTEQSQLVEFLDRLGKEWPIFAHVSASEKGEVAKQKESLASEKASELIKQNKIDEAIKTVAKVTEKKDKELI